MNIALVGNPNVGKSVIFNALTGKYATVSNYPGTTVEVYKGSLNLGGKKFTVIDTPGVNSLSPNSEDEQVTRQILSRGDIACIVQVADSKNPRRSLALALGLIELGIPLVLDLNMADEAKERGVKIDLKRLAQKLGIEVIETVAITGEGIAKLKEAISRAKVPAPAVEIPKSSMGKNGLVNNLIRNLFKISTPSKKGLEQAISSLTIRPLTGIPILLLVLLVMYLFVGRFAAGQAVDFFEKVVFGRMLNPFFIDIVNRYLNIGFVKELLVGEYGIITMAFTYAFAIIFPIVTAFFLFFGLLEDSGYLPRLSVLSDRLFKTMGLNGRAVLPIILGLGCGTMATLTTRILDTKKERILVSLLLTLAIPCSAQLGVIMGMLGSLSARAFAIWVLIMLSVMIVVGWLASKVVPGERSPFIQEIPPMRVPQIKNILVKTFARLKWYLKEAVPLFVLGTLILFVSDKIGLLQRIEAVLDPLVVNLLSLPQKATEAFIIGFLRRDYGAAGLYVLSKKGLLDHIQILVSLVVITLFVPCIAQFFVTVKERGMKVACLIGGFVFLFAFLFGGILNFTLRYLAAKGVSIV